MAGIYIHIPFCKKLCFYCDFYHILASDENRSFIEALHKEISIRSEYLEDENITTIYFGGGTPSVLSLNAVSSLLSAINKHFRVDEKCETTIEVNPDDLDPGYLRGLKNLGINRISIGVQSWRDVDLKMMNRRHDSAQATKALNDTFEAGFVNVSIDLIYGIPGMTLADWIENLDYTFSFDIKHLSAYHLTFEKGTVFGKMLEKGLIAEIDEELSTGMFNKLIEKAESAGLLHYEISNFGKPDFLSIHNTNYWKQINYLGLGPSAHSFNGYSRQWNISDLKSYTKSINKEKPFFEREDLDTRARFNEYIMTSLRTMWGIDMEYVERAFEKESYDYVINLAIRFKNYGLMKEEKNALVLTNQGKMISDNIISEFMITDED